MSRIITYPSIVTKESHTVIFIDLSTDDYNRLELYLQILLNEFDVYVYESKTDDLEWLNYVSNQADQVLINEDSQFSASSATCYGKNSKLVDPLAYFEQINIDNNINCVV